MPRTLFFLCIALLGVSCTHSNDPSAAAPAAGKEFVSLFNGKDLTGWFYGESYGKPSKSGEGYRVRDGALYCTAKDGGILLTEKQYENFVFHFEFKLTPGANNGIAIRAPRVGNAAYMGLEIQILDDTAPKYARLRSEQYHGSVYDLIAAERGHLKPVGEWNEEEITVNGRHIKVVLNGATIVDASLDDLQDPVKRVKHPGAAKKTGHIGFLGHGAEVDFRNMRVKEL